MHALDIARTHEILSRYRPIAPRPAPPPQNGLDSPSSSPPGKISELLPHAQTTSRASRSKKRGRRSCSCAVLSRKRAKGYVPLLPSREISLPVIATTKSSKLGGFPVLACPSFQAEKPAADMLAFSLFPISSAVTPKKAKETVSLDLNSDPETDSPQIIVPQPVRPVGSSICVGCISEDKSETPAEPLSSKKPEEVEEEVESEALPAVVSDSNNRVRLANSAYKKMVGQPECSWLDFMVRGGSGAGSNRINGEVMLDLSGSAVPTSSNAFSCSVTIEWACNGRRTFIRAPCDVNKVFCESKNYLFAWRIHTEASEVQCHA